ncbi:MAG: hypothetical protein ABI778_08095 [Ignavibacteriota bacterium]
MPTKIIIRRSVIALKRQPKTRIIRRIQKGDTGDSANIVSHVAGISLGGHRAVVLDAAEHAIYADKDTPSHANKVIGITTGAAAIGANTLIAAYGEIDEPSWAWTPGEAIYLSTGGLVTQTAPVSGFLLIIGFAITATKIFISIKQPIALT